MTNRTPSSDDSMPVDLISKSSGDSRTSSGIKDFSLDTIGQQNEIVRFRISEMLDRLEDLKSLQSDFSSVIEPIIAITDELPKAKIRISEVETLLTLEQAGAANMRRELADISKRLAEVSNDYSATTLQLHHLEASLKDRDATGEELRVSLRDKTLVAENLERQLFAETEQSRALLGESKALRIEAKSLDQALARSESELQDVREARGLLEQDNHRLQILSEEQAVKLSELTARSQDHETQADTARSLARSLEQQLANTVSAAQKAEAQSEVEMVAHRTERASLAMRLEAATGRLLATDQMLQQLRNQLRERDEAGRAAERGFKEASIERVTLERRLEGVQADLARQTERFLEMQRARSELDHRCEMFSKAIAAKDAALEQATGRVASLSDRIEQLLHRQEIERADFETVNHRLVEELQHERSERKMAQGALDIARESRVSLQKQHEALKRTARSFSSDEATLRAEAPVAPSPEPSNVRPFMPAEKTT
ncbi:chromosome partitioning protein ParA [Methylobacterium sp. WL69]|uniref:chromosome partitioning protein ParA n=1 Tax=Methylobacterium sp. WL69 TaxID=2603893 RepID=UPI0011CAE9F2|nr:chromosome partitioning protein ParA [Methylobacterium sp. WL69]TXM73017.1 chromosome partitioning protein ParA [Methylobacterium sp. WL69]